MLFGDIFSSSIVFLFIRFCFTSMKRFSFYNLYKRFRTYLYHIFTRVHFVYTFFLSRISYIQHRILSSNFQIVGCTCGGSIILYLNIALLYSSRWCFRTVSWVCIWKTCGSFCTISCIF
uniref:Uncharacterized protein n=1 Tax=Cacopsylla melanoneura TaxID=428564 RepID=A0A8D9AWZ2_9HEMI